MLLGSYPRLLVLALSLPEVSHALGLGNMRVESILNEPLSAQIDIIGATPEELQAITATVASAELFQRFNAERPAFLSSATFSVGTDATGKPVLNIQSSDAFTEPLVEFLIDLRSGNEQLVRDYSLLLDPQRVTPTISASVAVVSNEESSLLVQLPPPEVPNIVLATPAETASPDMLYRVRAHDTLRGIARHAGARSEAELQRMMLAIYRGNQQAFAGNINRLHSGALIRIPLPAGIQVFDSADMEREIRAQKTGWRRGSGPAVRRAPAPPDAGLAAVLSAMNQLDGQVQFLQQTLGETRRQLDSANARIGDMERRAPQQPVAAGPATSARGQQSSGRASLGAMLGGLALLIGALAFGWRRLRSGRTLPRKPVSVEEPTVEAPVLDPATLSVASAMSDATDPGPTVEINQVVDVDVNTVEMCGPADAAELDTAVMETFEPKAGDATSTVLDYNLSDLDGHAQHVEMPDTLRDQPVSVERRRNVVDSLLAALQRDPTRSDLHMKLLETLYTAAATNLRVFREAVRELVRHPERLNADEWQQVMAMGRQIAPDDALFADLGSDENIADCA